MKAIAITHLGLERFCADEIKEISGVSGSIEDYIVKFDFEGFEQLFELCYKAQSVIKIFVLLNEGKIGEKIPKNFSEWIDEKTEMKVKCKILENEAIFSQNLQEELSSEMLDEKEAKVNLSNPNTAFYCLIVKDKFYFGIDLSGEDLSKREYKIFNSATAIKATLGFVLLKAAGYGRKELLLDPLCNTGTVLIEAALHSSRLSPNFFTKDKFLFMRMPRFKGFDFDAFFSDIDKKAKTEGEVKIYGYDSLLKNIKATQKNAQIAGINKLIFSSRVEQKWLDFKFTKNEIDIIATVLPGTGRTLDIKQLDRTYEDFFYQAEYIVKPSGKIACLTERPEIVKQKAEKYKLKVEEEIKFPHGDRNLSIIVMRK
jgi:23S rRNA G2445 N2-methylase RlmL